MTGGVDIKAMIGNDVLGDEIGRGIAWYGCGVDSGGGDASGLDCWW